MAIAIDPSHLGRYKDIATLLIRHGRRDLIERVGLEDALLRPDRGGAADVPSEEADARELADDLESLGPTFIKLGQLLSTRADLLPEPYLGALERLQDDVQPFPYEQVEEIVSTELGARIARAFARFDPEPLAAASLGQVHHATLRDGRAVAVKVQRPGIRERVRDDLEAMEEIASFVQRHSDAAFHYDIVGMLQEFRKAILRELDYRLEATQLERLAASLAGFEHIVVPRPVEDYSTSRVLTMEFIHGKKVTALSPLARMEIDGSALADELFRAYVEQILVDGFFHADPHPGNVFLTDDRRIALLDVGMVAAIPSGMQDRLLRQLLALADGRDDEVADLAIAMGEPTERFDERAFRRRIADLVTRYRTTPGEDVAAGRVVMVLARSAAETGLRVEPVFAMLGRTLMSLERVGRTLDPAFDPNDALRRDAAAVLRRRLLRTATPSNVLSSALEMNDFLQRLPARLNHVLDAVERGPELRLRLLEETRLIHGLQKIANRITVGLLLAALIVGAAMLMRVETPFRVFGYPGFAMIAFLLAAGGAIALVWSIVSKDE